MANLNVTEVKGFNELNRNLKRLNDRVKRSEVIKLMRRLARPVAAKYRNELPTDKGVLRGSVGVRSLSSRRSGGNPVVSIRPGKRGRYDAFYQFMVIPKGTQLGSRTRGSRKGRNIVVPDARDRTLRAMENGLVGQASEETAKYVQKQIDRLSKP